LGQVRLALLEVDGTISILRYANEDIKYGLPLFPDDYKEVDLLQTKGPYACMFCGYIEDEIRQQVYACSCCEREKWTLAIKTPYVN
jgi:DNA-directed RNA polymerase subunit RPC12/RpoP